ncbi:DUF3099 domain-containing protein [Propionibacteriaceae bacterium G1746]
MAESRSDDLHRRRRNYAIAMGIRTFAFVMLFFVPGVYKLIPLAAAMVLPVIAVMLANAIDHKAPPLAPPDEPGQRMLTSGHGPDGEVIQGEVVDDEGAGTSG